MSETAAVLPLPGRVGPGHHSDAAGVSRSAHRYILCLLLAAYTLSYLDRQVVTILAESIKRDLKISNLQLGMLTGLAFALFYTFLGIPIARQAERRSRPLIVAGSMALWSGFTVLSGLATNFITMGVARLGVGFGEAGCNPCAHSLIADITPPERRGSALAFYCLGVPIGTILGLILGGAIADAFGWRAAFMVAGAPGLVLAAVIALTVKEPRARLAAQLAALNKPAALPATGFRQTLSELRGKRTFWLIALAAGLLAFIGYGHASFSTSFFLRVHGAEVKALAAGFGLGPLVFLGLCGAATTGGGALIGTWLGGWLADRAAARDKRAYMSLPAIASLASVPFIYFIYTAKSPVLALGLGVFPALLQTLWYGPVYATAQSVVRPSGRATTAAIFLFMINMLGLGLGPMCVGALTDVLAGPAFGMGQGEGVRWALIISGGVVVVSAALFWWARDTVREDIVS